ncbi:MAG: nitrite reductase small subunit NirD [bacterium]
MEFVKVAKIAEIPERGAKLLKLDEQDIALFKVEGKLYAINNVCAHQHFSALHKGQLDGLQVTCPMHGWSYSLETGKAISGDGRVKVYQVRVEGENVFLEMDGSGAM